MKEEGGRIANQLIERGLFLMRRTGTRILRVTAIPY